MLLQSEVCSSQVEGVDFSVRGTNSDDNTLQASGHPNRVAVAKEFDSFKPGPYISLSKPSNATVLPSAWGKCPGMSS